MHGKRIEGTFAEEYKDKMTDVEKKNSSEWRQKHEEMISAIRKAKKNAPPSGNGPTVELRTN